MRNAFYGWKIVAASFVILFVAVGAGLYVPPVFLVPLEQHFGWTRAAIAGGSAIAALLSGLTSPLAGIWIDRYGARRVMIAGSLTMATAFLLISSMTALWQLYLYMALAAVGLTCIAWVPNQTLISNWFTVKRGLAMGVALTGIGFGGMVMAPLAAELIAVLGWRGAYVALAALVAVTLVSMVAAVVRDRPADLGLLPDGMDPTAAQTEGASSQQTPGQSAAATEAAFPDGIELADALRTATFWTLSACHFLWVFANLSVIQHLVAFLRDSGFDEAPAAASLGVMVGISVIGRVVFGYLADRVTKRHMMSLTLLLHALATLCLFRIGSPPALAAFVVLFGLGLGGSAVLVPLLVGEYFGLRAFGKVLGVIMISATAGAALGPVLTGRIFDLSGSYDPAWTMHVVVFTAAALLIQALRHPLVGTREPSV